MRRLLTVLALLACASLPAMGGPNANGTIFLHDANLAYTTDVSDYCGQGTAPASCAGADVQIDETTPRVWKVYAAFPEGQTPRLKAIAYGVTYLPDQVTLLAWGACGGVLEVPGAGWPAPDTGTSVVFGNPKLTTISELYWFAGYWYNAPTPTTFALRSNPDQGGNFADDSVPAILDPITGYGTLGFGTPGVPACPGAPTPTGACCVNGVCSITTQEGCTGTWMGADTVCDPNPCPQPVMGACCVGETCSITTEADCTGTWKGADTVCDPNPCVAPPTGACCTGDFCSITTQADCPGTWLGPGTVCDPNPCITPPPTGACCMPDGSCTLTTEAGCTGGQWQGGGTVCDPNPCPQPPTGACCMPDGSCTITAQVDCRDGQWLGGGTVCDPNPCPQPPTGACCLQDGSCQITTQADCRGNWLGAGTTCDPNPCGVIPTHRTTWGQIKKNYR